MTEIICTVGPASADPKVLQQMARCGMTIARLNGAHNLLEWHQKTLEDIRALSLPIYMDIPGQRPKAGYRRDQQVIEFAVSNGVDYLGCSYAESAQDVVH